jgi:primosomal protein N' (replication factor Y)
VVVGARAAAWAPCPGLATVVVVDGHDEGLHQEQNPTWDATTVASERARRAGVPCVVTSPCPTLDLLAVASVVVKPSRRLERDGWAPLTVVDRRADDPRLGLYSEPLVRLVRDAGRVACVLNRKGRARLLSCRACGTVARCDRCGSAMAEDRVGGDGAEGRRLLCPTCGSERPWLCTACGSITLRQVRVGVSRAREDLATLSARPVVEVTAATPPAADDGVGAEVLVGTEAVLHRGGRFDAVAFLDFDGELLAPRFRAAEEALGLLARASRVVGGRAGRVLVQTRVPDHEVITAAAAADPARAVAGEREVRAALGWPPFAALAAVSGEGAAEVVEGVAGRSGIGVLGPDGGRWLIRAGDPAALADALAAAGRPGGRVRIEVDPLRV